MITSRMDFKKYIMRKLGEPVIQINVSEEQVEDRIDEAIAFWNDYHYNGFEHTYTKHLITAEDVEQGYIELPDEILGVTRIFNIGSSISMGSDMFNISYQYVLNNINELTNGSISNFWMNMQSIEFINEWLVGIPIIRYNKHINRLVIDDEDASEGTMIIIEGYSTFDQNEFYRMWSDRWLQNYAAVLVKEQWGNNLSKFVGMQLMGGVQFNASDILESARLDRQRMEEEAIAGLQPLIYNFIG